MPTIVFTLNGHETAVEVAADDLLAHVLRDRPGLTGVKLGCEEGECGTCTVLIDGVATLSCLYPAARVAGHQVTTIEGLTPRPELRVAPGGSKDPSYPSFPFSPFPLFPSHTPTPSPSEGVRATLHIIQQAFIDSFAAQCGYCTPGMIMAAKALLDQNPDPTHDQIVAAISGNLCRCTGYYQIVDAIALAARRLKEEELCATRTTNNTNNTNNTPHATRNTAIGRSVERQDARAKVTGESRFPQDFNREGQLYARVVWAAHPHARVLAVDVSAAMAVPGVVDVITAADVPVNEYGISVYDQPVLVPVGGKVRWMGDRIAVVVAETEKAAEQGRDRVQVAYQVLPPVTDPRQAMDDQVLVHEERGSNLIQHLQIRRGDVEAAFARADVIVEGTYETPCVEHAYLQPEACLGYIDEEGRIVLIVSTQWPHDDLRQLAHVLDLPEDRLREIVPAVGGAFGGREDMSLQPLVAVAVHKLRRPVKMVWTREESMGGHGKRHPFYLKYKTGCTRDGQLVAIAAGCVSDAGAYESTSVAVLSNAVSFLGGPYHYPACQIDGYTVYTNNATGMAMRGFGAPQAAVGYELQMDKMARALDMDPVALRMQNLLAEGDVALTGSPMPAGTGIRACLAQAARAAGWTNDLTGLASTCQVCAPGDLTGLASTCQVWVKPDLGPPSAPYKLRGIGVACAYKNVGYSFGFDDRSTARVVLDLGPQGQIARATIHMAAVEVGQGVFTALNQIAAQALGIPVEKVRFAAVDTGTAPDAGSCSASRHTYMSGNAVYMACQEALARRDATLRTETGETCVEASFTYHGRSRRKTTSWEPLTGACDPHISFSFGTQIALLEVDVETGEVEVLQLWAANDMGQAINPAMVYGQSAGGMHMGLGYALSEEIVHQDARLRTRRLSEYHIPTALDMPRAFVDMQVECPDPTGPYGATGLGETPLLATAPAILNAIADATGVYLDALPATPERVWRAIKRGSGR